MTRKSVRRLQAASASALAIALASCGGGGGGSGSTTPTPPVVTVTGQEDKFGTAFGADFRANANSEPATVNDSDIVPVSLTTEPIDITG